MTSLLYYVPRTDVHLTNLQHSALLLVLSYAKSLHRGLYDIYGCCLQVQVEVDDEGSLELKMVLMMTMSGGGGGSHVNVVAKRHTTRLISRRVQAHNKPDTPAIHYILSQKHKNVLHTGMKHKRSLR